MGEAAATDSGTGAAGSGGFSYPLLVEEIRERGVTAVELAEITGVRQRQIHHWAAATSRPRDRSRDRLVDLHYIVTQLSEVYRPEGVEIWIHSRNRELDGHRPIDLLKSGEFAPVLDAIDRLVHGAA